MLDLVFHINSGIDWNGGEYLIIFGKRLGSSTSPKMPGPLNIIPHNISSINSFGSTTSYQEKALTNCVITGEVPDINSQ